MIPSFIYGTAWKEEQTRRLTRLALEAGFRAIDTANQRKHYHEAGVGEALAEAFEQGLLSRQELFLQSKFTHLGGQDHRLPYDPKADIATQVMQSFESSLEHLGVDYLDSYVLHGPCWRVGLAPADQAAWETMVKLKSEGRVRALGVSNVTLEQLAEFSPEPTFVQNRCFAHTGWDQKIRSYCQAKEIAYQGFSLLTANLREIRSPEVVQMARDFGLTLPQLVFRFAIEKGILPLTGTTNSEHMKEDLEVLDLTLNAEQLSRLEATLS